MSDQVASPSSPVDREAPIPELVRLGEQLREAREQASLPLGELARRLRVEPRLLQALEAGDHSQLPEGVFIVALARRIAGSLQINVEEGIASVRQSRLMEHKPPGRSSLTEESPTPPQLRRPSVTPQPTRQHRRAANPQPLRTWLWPLAALLAAGGATAAWLLLQQPADRSPSSPAAVAPSPSPSKGPPTLAEAPGVPSAPTKQPNPSANRVPSSTAAPTPAPTAPLAVDSDTLRLVASEPSWIEVKDPEGRSLFEGTLSGEKRFPIGKGLEVIAGRPYAVRAALGANTPTPLGGVDDIRWKRFSPATLPPKSPSSSSPTP